MSATTASQELVDQYMDESAKHPPLSREEEVRLAQAYIQNDDLSAANKLVAANLRFVVKVAHEYSGYGLDLLDLIQEGNIGLMMAVKKFDPDKGNRLISYATWWIRAYINNYVIR
ncbi:MAG: sigma-70 family RNA polymerase sigma factor, partial [Myxococcota bacterium]